MDDSSKGEEVVVIFMAVIHDNPVFNNIATDSMTEIVNFAIEFRASNQQRYQLQIVMLEGVVAVAVPVVEIVDVATPKP